MSSWLCLIELLLLCVSFSAQFEIHNGVVGKPEVHCGIDTISVKINTEQSFNGRIYVDGESEKQHCTQGSSGASPHQSFTLPIGSCNMRRQRTLHPRGIAFSFTMIVSFHPFFVTGMDRAFSVRCFFLESIKGLNAEIDVGTLAPQNVDQEYSLPVCAYHLKDGIDGQVLRFAQVGQKVTHVWRCDQDASHVYGILIHSCYADDGHGNKFELVDDRGCSTDPYLLPQINYEQNAISAYTNAHVFKYADKVQLYFTCTVQLCYRHDGGCDGITPPDCGAAAVNKIASNEFESHEERSSRESSSEAPEAPKFVHLPENSNEFQPKPGSFQPVILGAPHPSIYKEDKRHRAEPFRGPKESSENAYRRDSPLNETDLSDEDVEEIVMKLSTTTESERDTPELVTFKRVSDQPMTTTQSSNSSSDERQRGDMETDVSVNVIVLPVEEKERKDTPQSLSFSVTSSPEVCMSRASTGIIFIAILIAIGGCCAATFVITRQRQRMAQHSKRRMDGF